MLKRTYGAVKEFLEDNAHEALDVAREMNGYDGCYDWCDTYDFDELCAVAAEGGAEAVADLVRACVYGDSYGGQVRYNGYGNIVSGELDDLLSDAEDYIVDIMSGLENYIDDDGYVNHINISKELEEVIDNSVSLCYTVKVTDIIYDLEGEDLTPEELLALPRELVLQAPAGEEDNTVDEDELVDLISDETGWCIMGYNYEIVKEN